MNTQCFNSCYSFVIVFCLSLIASNAVAQTDLDLYKKYIERKDFNPAFVERLNISDKETDYQDITIHATACQDLIRLIQTNKQTQVRTIYFSIKDTTDVVEVFKLLKQFTNIEVLTFSDYSDAKAGKPYALPSDILKLHKLKLLRIINAKNLIAKDLVSKINHIPSLEGLDLLDYKNIIPRNTKLPEQISFVQLSTQQLENLNTIGATWRFAKIEQREFDDPKDEHLLQKLAAIKSLEILDFQFCYVKDGSVFENFNGLRKLTIQPILSDEVNLVQSLSVLTQLKELAIYSVSDTSQSFLNLSRFENLESLDLRWLERFQKHPEELNSISNLTKLRSLSIQSCKLSSCPDFFKPLTRLNSFVFKWNVDNWNEKSIFKLPGSLYGLSDLKFLTICKSISEMQSVKQLTNLVALDLSANNLTLVPEDLAELKSLKSLSISSNLLAGNPIYPWERLTSLASIDLSRNKISVYPTGLQQLYQLKYLNISANQIVELPPLDHNIYELQVFAAGNNLFSKLPANISSYSNLEVLNANFCRLNELPTDLGSLKKLRILNLEGNKLKLLPTSLQGNTSLVNLNLKNNLQFDEKSIYNVIFKTPKKEFLWANLDNTGLASLPNDAPWDKLNVVLDLSNNRLKTLPKEMSQMKWFNIILRNNPFALDTGLIERGIHNAADAMIFFEQLGYQLNSLHPWEKELATSMTKAVNFLTFNNNFSKAVEFAEKAEMLDPIAYKINIDRYSLGIALYETKHYREAIFQLENHLKTPYATWWSTNMARKVEAALADCYTKIGEQRKSAEIHAFFAKSKKHGNLESSLAAAIEFLALKEFTLSRKHFNDASSISKAIYLEYPNNRQFHIYNYAEILLMAGKPAEVMELFQTEEPKVSGFNMAYRDYLETAAQLMIHPNNRQSIKTDYVARIAKNGKIKEWNYDNFNRWINASGKSFKEKKDLYELELLNK